MENCYYALDKGKFVNCFRTDLIKRFKTFQIKLTKLWKFPKKSNLCTFDLFQPRNALSREKIYFIVYDPDRDNFAQ